MFLIYILYIHRSLKFSGNKLLVPWILLYDAKAKKPLKKLEIVFEVDEYEVLRLTTLPVYGPPSLNIDASHPSLTAFEIVYTFKAVEGEDLSLGISVMFLLTLLGVVFLSWQALRPEGNNSDQTVKTATSARGKAL
jgi:hypothetical protein